MIYLLMRVFPFMMRIKSKEREMEVREVRRKFMKTTLGAVVICLVATSLIALALPGAGTPPVRPVKNIILMIGDGMGFTAVRATQIATVGPDDKLFMQTLPYSGLVTTHSLDALVPDSAATGTALATGYKTNNGMISVLPDDTILETVLEYAESKGKSTGLVATSRITHATPAAFAAHVPSRYMENDIALGIFNSGADVILGGGRRHFVPEPEGKRTDGRNLIDEAVALTYTYVETRDELLAVESGKVLGLFEMSHMSAVPRVPSLVEMTDKAIELLSQDHDGFFLMVEGSQIDWAAHSNDAEWLIDETVEFDQAVEVAIDFASTDPNTLLIVTADHETGGMAINGPDDYGWTTDGHTGTMVAVFATGPRSGLFLTGALHVSGVIDQTDIAWIIFGAIGSSKKRGG